MNPSEEKQRHPLYNSTFEKWALFFLVFMGVMAITYGILFLVDFLPEKPTPETQALTSEAAELLQDQENTAIESDTEPVDPLPVAIIFDSLDKKIEVLNPASGSLTALNEALLSGVVRHPDSADFDHEGTIFLFGHSSYLPNVINKNFQAFNGIQNLKWGDVVRLQSSDMEYVYRVDDVYQVKAADTEVAIERGESKLVLTTCNVFGSKDDRYIVEASLVESYRI